MLSRSVVRTLPVVAAGAAVLAGCSSAHNGAATASLSHASTPRQAMVLAARQADLTNSVTATFSMRMGGTIGMTASGSIAEQIRPSLYGQVDLASMGMAGQSMPGGMTEVLTDHAIYMKSAIFGAIADGKQWVEVRYSDLAAKSGIDLGQIFQQARNSDPIAQTKILAGATDVRDVGRGTIDGVAVTEYTGRYTIARALAQLPASDRTAIQEQAARAGLTGGTFTVWLDDQQRARKLILNEQGTSVNLTVTMLVTSINQPVHVQLPDASQVSVLPLGDLGSGA